MARKNDSGSAPRCVLAMRFSALGDVCMAIPPLYTACRLNPDTRFIFLTKKAVEPLFLNRPSNLTVLGVDLKKEYCGAIGVLRLWRMLHKKFGIDAVADLHSVLRTHLVRAAATLSGVSVAEVDKMRRRRQELVSRGALNTLPLPSMVERYGRVFSRLGLKMPDSTDLYSSLGHIAPGQGVPLRPDDETWIAVAPFAAHRGKIYPEEKMREVVERLASIPHTRIFLFGGAGHEAEVLSQWEKEIPHVTSCGGKKLGFAHELAVMQQCRVMVSMDSANMHMASLTGTPVVSVWGATHPWAGFYGWRQNLDGAVQRPLQCRPCSVFGNKVCRFGTCECLTSIEPRLIVSRVLETLKKPQK